jgi:hypothetical protein
MIKTDIIPVKSEFYGIKEDLDLEAICVFTAIGFFLESDTYYKKYKTLPNASNILFENKQITQSETYFKWHHSPENIDFNGIVDGFTELFEKIVKEQTEGKTVVLPLSGGLDSRSQAGALKRNNANVNAYSYHFKDGLNETYYAEKIAQAENFRFQKWEIQSGYLWDKIDKLADINQCYSEFTHPRQMAFIEKYNSMGDVFSLGHWGDVLFDDMGVKEDLSYDEQAKVVLKKVVKKGGMELATSLWSVWGLKGDFSEYLYERILQLIKKIGIEHSANANIRAFKSMYWATRWTSSNLSIFGSQKPITLPYYDNRMCEFICKVPEKYLAGRQVQIEYLKRRAPELAKIEWQDHRPFNLYNYHLNKFPYNFPYRLMRKLKSSVSNKKYIQRNWELQFLGEQNEIQLENRLFNEQKLLSWLPKEIISEYYKKFQTENDVYFSHSVSMLLTLSLFSKREL